LNIKALKGFKDILPDEVHLWQRIETVARDVFRRFGFAEIKMPILEKTELFARSIGAATDIVEKEMYTFPDKNGESITMRPEGTASLLRAFIEHGMHVRRPVQRLYTMGPMFRHERPQKGRLRQFHQISAELLGSNHPLVDAEIMAMAWLLLVELGISVSLQINSLGCPACRPLFKETLVDFLQGISAHLCPDCERRRHTNPLRVLDCKSSQCRDYYKNAPSVLDHLCVECEKHFLAVKEGLKILAVPYTVNSFMVRGLDYYTRSTFELITGDLGAQSAVGAGGRYDGLVAQLGGPAVPGIGFAVGVERLVLLLKQGCDTGEQRQTDLFVAALGAKATVKSFALVHALRAGQGAAGRGLSVAMDHEGRSLKSQMKQAGRLNARYTLIIGEDELENREGILKDMTTGEQEQIVLPRSDSALDEWRILIAEKISGATGVSDYDEI